MNKNLDSFICRNKCEIKEYPPPANEIRGDNYSFSTFLFDCFCGKQLICHAIATNYKDGLSCPQCHQKFIIKKENDGYWMYKI